MADSEHQSVLLDAAMNALAIRAEGVYVDATFGRGGHSRAILERLGPHGRVIAFDQDPEAGYHAEALAAVDTRFSWVAASFAGLESSLSDLGVTNADGVLFDLGVSSPQFDRAERGFSFRYAGPLDMRMNPEAGQPLSDWLMNATHGEIARVIKKLGEEPMAGRIAAAILEAREADELRDTRSLAAIVKQAVPARVAAGKSVHPATRTFQAFRMHVNDELAALEAGLWAGLRVLASDGRLVAISFHSLEDRLVKRFMRHQARPPQPELPMVPAANPALTQIGKPITPDAAEQAANPRSRSAIMRVAQRTEADEVAP